MDTFKIEVSLSEKTLDLLSKFVTNGQAAQKAVNKVIKSYPVEEPEDVPEEEEEEKEEPVKTRTRATKAEMQARMKVPPPEEEDEEEEISYTATEVRKLATEKAQESVKAKEAVKKLISSFDKAADFKALKTKYYPDFVKKLALIKK